MNYDSNYFDKKWIKVIRNMPIGADYRFDLRQYGHDIVKNMIEDDSKVFDFACGLGVIDSQLHKKGCQVSGCDISPVAIEYINKQKIGDFRVSDKIHGTGYDYILAIQFLEHIKNPVDWLKEMFKHGKTVICILPNNFRRHGEHIDMQWSSWDEFNKMFKDYEHKRLDINKYPVDLIHAFQHPIVLFKNKKRHKMTDSNTRKKI
jgi:hypothetical protein